MLRSDLEEHAPSPGRLAGAAARFLDYLPALLVALLCLRVAELAVGIEPGSRWSEVARIAAIALGLDLLNLVRYLPVLFLCSLPFLLIRPRSGRFYAIAVAWSLVLLVQAALIQYFLTARVPLGADLFAYSWADIRTTVEGGASINAAIVASLALGLIVLWNMLARLSRRPRPVIPPRAATALLGLALLVLIFAPRHPDAAGTETEDVGNLRLNKAAYFFDDSFSYLSATVPTAPISTASVATPEPIDSKASGFHYLDPKYPFLRTEQTPDTLGPFFKPPSSQPPNLVFIIVEGLGRSFSGPHASLGSFTPELDRLAGEGLYWENFLAVQGRTFAALPSIFASLPFGENGFAMLDSRMPEHISLLSVLKQHGYRLKFYYGADLDFDNERLFLKRQGVDVLVGQDDYGAGYVRDNYWGYADDVLITRTLAGESRDTQQPFVSIIQTMTTHTPYTFPGQEKFTARFEQRLEALGIPEERMAAYRANRKIYTSILYTDAAIARFIEKSKLNPAYQNTIFIVTGDHRLPEIPMATRIDRYHVPLLIFSPLLKAPARIKSVSSHFDIAPSLLAFLSHNYGVKTPQAVTWLGTGLDMETSFRNIHDFPLKQTKTNLVDYVSGTWFINQDALYTMSDGMDIEPADDPAALARVQEKFAAFRAANNGFASSLALLPKGAAGQLATYREQDRKMPSQPAAGGAVGLDVREVHAPEEARAGPLSIDVVFTNTGPTDSGTFVPLVVLLTEDGREVSESYGLPQQLSAGKTVSVQVQVKSPGIARGRYFLLVFPSHPETGKNMGIGRYRIPIRFLG